MNKKEYNNLKRQAEERYQKLLDMAEKQRISELAAIETVWRMSHPTKHQATKTEYQDSQQPTGNGRIYGSLASSVTEALQFVPDTFTVKHIRNSLKEIAPEVEANCKNSSITGRLIRLVKKGVIEQASVGKGSKLSEYRKITDNEKDATDGLLIQ